MPDGKLLHLSYLQKTLRNTDPSDSQRVQIQSQSQTDTTKHTLYMHSPNAVEVQSPHQFEYQSCPDTFPVVFSFSENRYQYQIRREFLLPESQNPDDP